VIENAGFVNEIVWSGEVSFKVSSTVDRQIAIAGLLKIRTFMTDNEVNLPGLTVWCGMSSRGFVGPFFFFFFFFFFGYPLCLPFVDNMGMGNFTVNVMGAPKSILPSRYQELLLV